MTAEPVTADVEFVSARRAEIVTIAGELFAERGYANTTVREIADAAGILSGSLYHHFDSKESMVDEILTGFLDELFGAYAEIVARQLSPRETLLVPGGGPAALRRVLHFDYTHFLLDPPCVS